MRNVFFIIVVPLVVLAIALTGSHILVERLFVFIILIILAGFLFSRLALRGIRGALKNPGQHYLPGQTFQVEATVENRGMWPGSYFKMEILTGAEKRADKTPVRLDSGIVYNWSKSISFPRRGCYKVGPLRVEASDPFDIIHFKQVIDPGKEVIICPSTVDLPDFETEQGLLRNKMMFQEAGAFSGIREYVPGDSLSRIHWRSTAHTGKLIVKEFDADSTERIWVIPDLSKNSQAGSGAETTTEYIITIAASIVRKYAAAGRPVGLIAQNSSYHHFPARSGNLHMWRIMESLAVMESDGDSSLSRTVYRARDQLSGNAVTVLITASDRDEAADSIISSVKQGLRAIVILVDASSFGGEGSPHRLLRLFSAHNVPVYLVRKGKNLDDELNSRRLNLYSAAGTG
ncbi:MAG: DUF58 domain-containing protein [Dehalococcoidales bacterium]|nr:DUF58 domain-containing protein [Dehalococcoidales bacterium]